MNLRQRASALGGSQLPHQDLAELVRFMESFMLLDPLMYQVNEAVLASRTVLSPA
jgi:hypothetical protein